MKSDDRIAATYRALGEFVIVFQWVEHLYRQIGWFILDPEHKQWPPMQLRKETNHDLINKVTDLFVDLTIRHNLPLGTDKADEMIELREHFHTLRKYRNRLLHSTFVELKAGGEVHGYIRANPEIGVDPDSGELIHDQEDFSAESIHTELGKYADSMFRLGINYKQVIQWHSFINKDDTTG